MPSHASSASTAPPSPVGGGAGIWGVLPHIGGSWGPPSPCQRSWGPCLSDLGVSGFSGLSISRDLGVPVGQIWGLGALGFGVSFPTSGGLGVPPPHVRGPGVPVGQIWGLGALGFGVPPPHIRGSWGPPPTSEVLGSLYVSYGRLWVLGSPHFKGSWGPCRSDLGSGGSGIWGVLPPTSGGLGVPPPCQRSWGPCWSDLGVSGFWGPPMSEGQVWGALGFGVPPFRGVLGSLLVRFGVWGLWDLGSPPTAGGLSPPVSHIRGPGVPIGPLLGSLAFGVPHV